MTPHELAIEWYKKETGDRANLSASDLRDLGGLVLHCFNVGFTRGVYLCKAFANGQLDDELINTMQFDVGLPNNPKTAIPEDKTKIMEAAEILREKADEDGEWFKDGYFDGDAQAIYRAIIAYAREKCREQRELCAKAGEFVPLNDKGLMAKMDITPILNAPEPNFD